MLKAANVEGTKWALSLASLSRPKWFHSVSTLSITGNSGAAVQETHPLLPADQISGGYASSKWVADRLVQLALPTCPNVSILRPGAVFGDSETGACNTEDTVCRLVKGCLELGLAPHVPEAVLALTPVDYVAKAIVALSLANADAGDAQPKGTTFQIYHLTNDTAPSSAFTWNDLFSWMIDNKYAISIIPHGEWISKLAASSDNAAYALLPVLGDPSSWGSPQFDTSITDRALAPSGVTCPRVNDKLLRNFFTFLHRSGFLGELPPDCF